MARHARHPTEDLRGASRLAVDATTHVTNVVEEMHRNIGAGSGILGQPLGEILRLLTAPTYATIRLTTKAVGAALDLALAQLEPALRPSAPGPRREMVISALNGVVGDYLEQTGNPLAIRMELRFEGRPLTLGKKSLAAAIPNASRKVLVLVHGSSASDYWRRRGHDHGAALAKDLGFTPIYVRYNSGRHVSTNGRELAGLLERLVRAWPGPLDELVVLAHSMGGLVTRSACQFAEASRQRWRSKLKVIVFLGTPHHGAPLERGGNWLETLLGVSSYSAPLARLGRLRSAGITDLRYGNVLDEHWDGRDRFALGGDGRRPLPLPKGVACYAVAATLAARAGADLVGDGLVPLASALGRHAKPELTLAFDEDRQWIGRGMGHLDLLNRAEVYATVRGWLAAR